MTFCAMASGFVRSRALVLLQALDAATLDLAEAVGLAAHLYAIATQLLLNEGTARLKTRRDPPAAAASARALLASLAGLSPDLEAAALYWTLIGALRTLEAFICVPPDAPPTRPGALPRVTRLEELPAGDFRGISGDVHHWIRPHSALAVLRERRFQEASAVAPDPEPHPGTYLQRLAMHWDSDPQLPRVRRAKGSVILQSSFAESGLEVRDGKSFKLALCPLPGPFHPRFEIERQEGGRFRAVTTGDPMHGGLELRAHLGEVVAAADAAGVRLLLFPELTIDVPAREWLAGLLAEGAARRRSLCGVVPGSFHVAAAGSGQPPEPPVNRAMLLDAAGRPALEHRKKGRFRILSRDVVARRDLFPSRPPDSELKREIFEDIRYGSELEILDTPLGRLALLICADAIAMDDRGYLPAIRRLRPDLLLVIAMTPETEPFEAFALEMSRFWIGTLFVNAHCICPAPPSGLVGAASRRLRRLLRLPAPGSHRNLAACNLAVHETQGAPPTLSRWRFGAPEPECYFFHPVDGKRRGWRPLSRAPGETGVSLLRTGTESVGLVVDLGVHG